MMPQFGPAGVMDTRSGAPWPVWIMALWRTFGRSLKAKRLALAGGLCDTARLQRVCFAAVAQPFPAVHRRRLCK